VRHNLNGVSYITSTKSIIYIRDEWGANRVRVVVEPDGEGFHAYCPALKGLHAPGATEAEALANAGDAALAYIESLIKHGDPIPNMWGSLRTKSVF